MNYIIAAGICIIALLIAIFSMRDNELISRKQKDQFISLSALIIYEIIVDTISLYLNGTSEEYNHIFKIIKMSEFIVAPFIPALLSHLICRKKYWLRIKKYFYIIIGVNTTLQLITLYYPLMFRIEENAVYYRTSMTSFYVLLLFVCLILLCLSATKTFIQNFNRFNNSALITTLFIIAGFIIRAFCVSSNADWVCISFSYFLFMEYFSNSFYKIDTLTSLLNQKAFINRVSQIDFSTVFIAIDINNFKSINDTYGHAKGNQCLRKVGEAIYNAYNEVGYCYRSGGDEFTIILKPGELAKMKSMEGKNIYDSIKELMHSLDDELRRQSKKDKLLKDGVSQGFGIYYIPKDCSKPGEYKSVEAALKYADDRMYEAKSKRIARQTS